MFQEIVKEPEPMKDITTEYLDKIKKDLNCVSIILIIGNSEIPCPDARSGTKCEHQHEISSAIDSMSIVGAISVFQDAIINAANNNL